MVEKLPVSLNKYQGSELELFSQAFRWKKYWSSMAAPFVRGSVLEVGAGLGGNRKFFSSPSISCWTFLEPDSELCTHIYCGQSDRKFVGSLPDFVKSNSGDLFESILYVDVLEHIENDREELRLAYDLLSNGGFLVILAPAHSLLYSEFDRNIGHFRRYNRRQLLDVVPSEMKCTSLFYLDSVGTLLSFSNRFLLRQAQPHESQVAFWDKYVVPTSRLLDRWISYTVGKSVLGVFQKT